MALFLFIVLNVAAALIDGIITYHIREIGVDLLLARLVGVSIALLVAVFTYRRLCRRSSSSSFLPVSFSGIMMIVSYGLFALILLRNDMLQWPVAFISGWAAALLLGAFGYRRALKNQRETAG